MKEYLKAIIMEQKNRALFLKNLVHPLRNPQLLGLAERCRIIIDTNIQKLRFLLEELEGRNEDDIRDILRGVRGVVREIKLVEYHGISPLYFVTLEKGSYLNDLIFRIHQEINLPLTPPSVSCTSTNYYYFYWFTNVIFVPVGESNFLLHLPDVFHEIGHEVLHYKENELRLEKVNECYDTVIKRITDYYKDYLTQKIREYGPPTIPMLVRYIHEQWKDNWINEFFCDLFALYTLGPAYAWSHLHLTTKNFVDIYKFYPFLPQSHPSDDSRMRMLLIGLNKLGFEDEAATILSKWQSLPFVRDTQPIVEYQYAYPDDLMEEIADLFLAGLKESGFSIITPDKLRQNNQESIINILNEAWNLFWDNPDTFRDWEENTIQRLKSIIQE